MYYVVDKIVEKGWNPRAMLSLECHIGDKIYHRGVTPRVVALSTRWEGGKIVSEIIQKVRDWHVQLYWPFVVET